MQPSLVEARFNRGVAYLSKGDFGRAAVDFANVWSAARNRLKAAAAYHHAIALDRQGRAADTELWLTRALSIDPALDAALLYLGFIRERRGNLQEAGKAYKQYLERHPESAVALLRFGISAQRAGFAETAKTYLQRVVVLAPNSPEAVEARKFLVMWE